MRVIDFVNWISNFTPTDKVRTSGSSAFKFVVNPSDHAQPDSDTCICFDGGISVKELVRYVALHNIEAYEMYKSSHGNICYNDAIHQRGEVIVS